MAAAGGPGPGLEPGAAGVWVITGLAYDATEEDLASGIQVPDAWWKVVADEQDGEWFVLSILVPETAQRSDPPMSFVSSVDEIERVSGFDLLSELNDAHEAELESAVTSWTPAEMPEHRSSPPEATVADGELVNINTATAAELEALPGIGSVLAGRIIEARPFTSVDELTRVRGIGAVTAERVSRHITTGD